MQTGGKKQPTVSDFPIAHFGESSGNKATDRELTVADFSVVTPDDYTPTPEGVFQKFFEPKKISVFKLVRPEDFGPKKQPEPEVTPGQEAAPLTAPAEAPSVPAKKEPGFTSYTDKEKFDLAALDQARMQSNLPKTQPTGEASAMHMPEPVAVREPLAEEESAESAVQRLVKTYEDDEHAVATADQVQGKLGKEVPDPIDAGVPTDEIDDYPPTQADLDDKGNGVKIQESEQMPFYVQDPSVAPNREVDRYKKGQRYKEPVPILRAGQSSMVDTYKGAARDMYLAYKDGAPVKETELPKVEIAETEVVGQVAEKKGADVVKVEDVVGTEDQQGIAEAERQVEVAVAVEEQGEEGKAVPGEPAGKDDLPKDAQAVYDKLSTEGDQMKMTAKVAGQAEEIRFRGGSTEGQERAVLALLRLGSSLRL